MLQIGVCLRSQLTDDDHMIHGSARACHCQGAKFATFDTCHAMYMNIRMLAHGDLSLPWLAMQLEKHVKQFVESSTTRQRSLIMTSRYIQELALL